MTPWWVPIVAKAHVGAFYLDFSRDAPGIVGVYADFHVEGCAAGASNLYLVPVGIAYNGGALSHTVAHGIVEANLVEEFLHLRIEGGAAKDHLLKLTAEGIGEFCAELLLNGGTKDGDAPVELCLVDERLELALVHLLHHQRHCNDDIRVDLLEGLHYDLGAGDAA